MTCSDVNREWEYLHRDYSERVKNYLMRRWNLQESDAEDIAATVILLVSQRLSRVDMEAVENVTAFVYGCARNEARRYHRKKLASIEAEYMDQLMDDADGSGELARYRARQSIILSGVLREFVRRQEAKSGQKLIVGLRRKELYERLLTLNWKPVSSQPAATGDQSSTESAQLAADSGQKENTLLQGILLKMTARGWCDEADRKKARDLFDTDRKRIANEIQDIMSELDPRRTVFRTVWNDLEEPVGAPPLRHRSSHQPVVRNFRELARWVASETDAFCPAEWRLQAFAEHHGNGTPIGSRHELRDLEYHIIERGCCWCGNMLADLSPEDRLRD